MVTRSAFLVDPQGSRFADVDRDPDAPLEEAIAFIGEFDRARRMVDAEVHHLRPAFAGVVREFEMEPVFRDFLAGRDAHHTQRFRQAVGVIVRMVMAEQGWVPARRTGSLGQRAPTAPRTTQPGAYRNTAGLSIWFTRTKHYEPAPAAPHVPTNPAAPGGTRRSAMTMQSAFSTLKRGDRVVDAHGQEFVIDRVQRRADNRPANVVVLTLPGARGGRWLVGEGNFDRYRVVDA